MSTSDEKVLSNASLEFRRFGFAKVGVLFPLEMRRAVAVETLDLVARHGVRRDLRFAETDHTPRRMRNVTRAMIAAHGMVIPEVYPSLTGALSAVAGDDVLPCPYEPEQYVITRLECCGDTHGWHWDDYAFALVWIVECPPAADGGIVQGVPGTRWNKDRPRIQQILENNPVDSWEVRPGEAYLMRTDTTLHRVQPITNGRRTIVNMAYACRDDLAKRPSHETMDNLWAPAPTDHE